MSKILVTGGCGFIGANLVPMLQHAGHDVVVLDNLSRGRIEYLADPGSCRFVEGDIRDDRALEKAMKGVDAVIHLAAYGSVVESVANPEENYDINVAGTFKVLQSTHEHGIDRLIFASTGGALIGNATPPVSEKSVPRPISPYGAGKLAGEGYCCAFANSYDMSVTALRFANVVGPISWHKKGAVTAFFKAILRGDAIHVFGDGTATRDFLYVDDLCRGICNALTAPLPGFNVFHLASGREVSIRELAEIARTTAGSPNHRIVFDAKRKGEVERNFADFDLARERLDFEPRVSLESALQRTWQWIQKYTAQLNRVAS